jgi:hypothetical protein
MIIIILDSVALYSNSDLEILYSGAHAPRNTYSWPQARECGMSSWFFGYGILSFRLQPSTSAWLGKT